MELLDEAILGMEDGPFQIISLLAFTYPVICVSARRLHDINYSGWWMLIPFGNLVWVFIKGTAGPNRFGPDPLA